MHLKKKKKTFHDGIILDILNSLAIFIMEVLIKCTLIKISVLSDKPCTES